jgi:ankyrin repeat protein
MLIKTELFNQEIPLAMCNSELLEIEHRRLRRAPSWLVAEHVFRKTWASDYGTKNLPAAIRLAAQSLLRKTTADPKTAQEDCIRKLSKAAVWAAMNTNSVLHLLVSGSEEDRLYLDRRSTTNHVVAAAAYLGDREYITRLANGGEIDCSENIYFGNPLRCAVAQGHYELAKILLDHGADVNHGGAGKGQGSTALQAAAVAGREDIINLILDEKYRCHTSGNDYDRAILEAASAGHLSVVQDLMKRVNMDPSQVLRNCLLLKGSAHGHENVVLFALQIGANPNTAETCNSFHIPITDAANHGYDSIVKILLENGAIPKLGGRQDTISKAARREHRKTVQVLLEYGIDLTHPYLGFLGSVPAKPGKSHSRFPFFLFGTVL